MKKQYLGIQEKIKQLLKGSTLLSCIWLSFSFLNQALASENMIKVCAVPQLYNALNEIEKHSSTLFKTYYATSSDLYATLSNNKTNDTLCDIVLSSDEKLPIRLIRSQKADGSSLKPFAKVPLVLWSKDANLLKNNNGKQLINNGILKSIAIAKPDLSPVGYATQKVLSSPEIKINGLKDHVFRAEQEYQVYSMVSSGNVQVGIVSKPLVIGINNQNNGSYWEIPRSYYPDIQYYVVVMKEATTKPHVAQLVNNLIHSPKTKDIFKKYGFYDLKTF